MQIGGIGIDSNGAVVVCDTDGNPINDNDSVKESTVDSNGGYSVTLIMDGIELPPFCKAGPPLADVTIPYNTDEATTEADALAAATTALAGHVDGSTVTIIDDQGNEYEFTVTGGVVHADGVDEDDQGDFRLTADGCFIEHVRSDGTVSPFKMVNRNEPQSGTFTISSIVPSLSAADLAALPVGVTSEIFRLPIPDLVPQSACRKTIYKLTYRIGSPYMQLGANNWYTSSHSNIGNGSPPIQFSTRDESHSQGQMIGGYPVFGHRELTILVGGTAVAIPDVIVELTPQIQTPSAWDVFVSGVADVVVSWHLA